MFRCYVSFREKLYLYNMYIYICKNMFMAYIYMCNMYDKTIPRPSKGVKFQPPGLFMVLKVIKGLKFQTIGGFR